jgi:hypothetical protein
VFKLVLPFRPPATNTLPLVAPFDEVASCVAVWSCRAPVIGPVAAQVRVAGS